MREQKGKESRNGRQRPKPTPSAPPMSSRIIRKDSDHVVRQYPANVGYHGSDEERKLNPEE